MPPNNAPSLSSLPREVFDSIISAIEDRADISSLSRTSKAIRLLTVELVFQDVTMVWTGSDEVKERDAHAVRRAEFLAKQNPNVIETSPGCECPRLDLLLRSILENPTCGEYVRKINLQCVRYRDFAPYGTKPKLPPPPNTEVYNGLIVAAMRRARLDRSGLREKFQAGLETNEFDIVISLLIPLCPNVTSLTLGLDIIVCNPVLASMLKEYTLPTELTRSISRLQHLKDIRLGTSFESETHRFLVVWPRHAPEKILDLNSYLALFYLPELEQVEISLPSLAETEIEKEFEWPAGSPPSSSALQVLHLLESTLPPDALQNILKCTPRITRLEYEFKMWSDDQLQAQDLSSALACIKDSLKHFKFKHRQWSTEDQFIGSMGDFEEDYEYVIGHCSLKELSSLETVTIPSCVLLGWFNRNGPELADILPRSLITICLANDLCRYDTYEKSEKDLMPTIHRFVEGESWRKTAPRLEEFNLEYGRWKGKDETVALFKQNGLRCQIAFGGHSVD